MVQFNSSSLLVEVNNPSTAAAVSWIFPHRLNAVLQCYKYDTNTQRFAVDFSQSPEHSFSAVSVTDKKLSYPQRKRASNMAILYGVDGISI